jgi:hypothetical protein
MDPCNETFKQMKKQSEFIEQYYIKYMIKSGTARREGHAGWHKAKRRRADVTTRDVPAGWRAASLRGPWQSVQACTTDGEKTETTTTSLRQQVVSTRLADDMV